MTTANRNYDYEWAEYNLPHELWSAAKPAVSPFARRVLNAGRAPAIPGAGWPFSAPARARSDLGALLLPGLGFPLPKL